MSEPDLAAGHESTPEELQPKWEHERQTLLAELEQLRSIEHNRLERISLLEQALDQALTSLNDLTLQMRDQQVLEDQLATTEEFSHVQQQAITKLKLQLTQQEQILEARIAEAQEQNQTFQELLTATEAIAQAQQAELERLRVQIVQDRSEMQVQQKRLEKQLCDLQGASKGQQQHVLEMETQALAARTLAASLEVKLAEAQQQIESLYANLSQRQTAFSELETQLEQAYLALEEHQLLLHQMQQAQVLLAEHHTTIATLQQDLVTAHGKIEELETQMAKQVMLQAKLQQAGQELEAERDRYQSRVLGLEQQAAEMQEQILKQARQANEYETAVQHWKDRCAESQRQALQLKEQLAKRSENCPEDLSELLMAELEPELAETSEPMISNPTTSSQFGRGLKVDLPAFLARRRS
ncbi:MULTISPECIES: hypothetical protein [Trichocoleus]|uniref:Chromosome partition protein Smc n=1 Tax=Trichocoleus desertorum GB2-A4 TaxID=2933944 RepID=A0ABV0J482_9CYAN|nr:hypothetical protein [Trichocoleus sp. FACHB-46]MBD1861936.1 hypothetical protein [Trichocoleus sp. FACHB-46]